MSVQRQASEVRPDRTEALHIHNRGVWFDNADGTADNQQVVNDLGDISPEPGMVWEISAIDYMVSIEASDSVDGADLQAMSNGIFVTWSLGHNDLPTSIDPAQGNGAQPGAGESLEDAIRRDNVVVETDGHLLIKNDLVRHQGGVDDAGNNRITHTYAGGITHQGRWWPVPRENPYTLDFRSDLQFNLAFAVSVGNADLPDPVLHLEAVFNLWIDTLEATV